MKLRMAEK
jgi:hypothetical protein